MIIIRARLRLGMFFLIDITQFGVVTNVLKRDRIFFVHSLNLINIFEFVLLKELLRRRCILKGWQQSFHFFYIILNSHLRLAIIRPALSIESPYQISVVLIWRLV
jgi:hypothetical protein